MSLEQVLEINQKVFAASLIRPQEQENAEALQREESTLKEIPQRIVDEAFGSVNELLTIDRMGIAVYNETTHLLEYASSPGQEMPEMVQLCFDSREYISEQHRQAIPLMNWNVKEQIEDKRKLLYIKERRLTVEPPLFFYYSIFMVLLRTLRSIFCISYTTSGCCDATLARSFMSFLIS